jgi:hypothetical protein
VNVKAYHVADAEGVRIDAVEEDEPLRDGAQGAILGKSITLSIEGLKDFFFADWHPELVDLMIIAAAVEYCDLSVRRPAWGWARAFDLRVAVHDDSLWNKPSVRQALGEALAFLTGDRWALSFVRRRHDVVEVGPRKLDLSIPDKIIMPYSDGLDSRAVAALVAAKEKGGLVRVRLGTKGADTKGTPRKQRRFTAVPFDVKLGKRQRVESSARSRGFKFAMITGIAAQLAKVDRIVVTESGQGALGPIIASSGQIYPDYRVHPAFTQRIDLRVSAHLVYEGRDSCRGSRAGGCSDLARHALVLAGFAACQFRRPPTPVRHLRGLHAAPHEHAHRRDRRGVRRIYLGKSRCERHARRHRQRVCPDEQGIRGLCDRGDSSP